MKYILVFLFLSATQVGWGAGVDTLFFSSRFLHGATRCIVIKPSDYFTNTQKYFPVVYLLHGYSGDYADWMIKVPQIKKYADTYQLILVCPDGKNSYYLDNADKKKAQFESYLSTELPAKIDSLYRTVNSSKFRAVTGLSMGGHGALFMAIRHPEVYGAAGSMSGAVDLVGRRMRKEITDAVGDTSALAVGKFSVLELAATRDLNFPIMIDCGVEDPFIQNNRELHQLLLKRKIPHDYIEREGTHNWSYWSNSIEFQLLFFRKWFDKNLSES